MKVQRCARLLLLVVVVLGGSLVPAPTPVAAAPPAPTAAAQAQTPVPGPCVDGVLPHGALSRICIPSSGWNGDLVVWAHGYVDFTQPLGFYHLTTPDGAFYTPDLAQQLGFAFATTSYRQNGLAILEGVQDVAELVRAFRNRPEARKAGAPRHTYLIGASEGGAVTALSIERNPQLFSGGLALCGPIGDFQAQIDYIGDFRVLFDYYFPNVLPGGPTDVPAEVIANWEKTYVPKIKAAVAAAPDKADQLIRASHAATDGADPSTVATTVEHVLWYNVFATNDAVKKLGGNPFGNRTRWYWGSNDDLALNLGVRRFDANPRALAAVAPYQTSGKVTESLVTMHTTGDEILPFWHEFVYGAKVDAAGSRANVSQFPTFRYGHCNFTASDVLFGFAVLVIQVSGREPAGITQHVDVQGAREQARRDMDRARGAAGR
jgi:hypothetical protein